MSADNLLSRLVPDEVKGMTLRDVVREWAETLEELREVQPHTPMRDQLLESLCNLFQGAYEQGFQHATNGIPRIEDFCGKSMEEFL